MCTFTIAWPIYWLLKDEQKKLFTFGPKLTESPNFVQISLTHSKT